ncbi:MAG TPA: cytochrome c family protein [Hyphomonadaceae bacterium]|nr:cytochrome c family protein [Hyphomonadaceae bacterium]
MKSTFFAALIIGAAAFAPLGALAQTPAKPTTATPTAAPIALDIKDAAGKAMTGNPDAGKRVFLQCQACHSIVAGQNRVGPSLAGIIGRKAGTVANFKYSPANKNSGLTWTEQQLFTYLENPRGVVAGTTMAFAGLKQPQQRADVIAYLKTNAK